KTNEFFGICPNGHPYREASKDEILKNIKKLGEFITLYGDPALITIARSSEGYTPAHLLPFIETHLLAELKKVIQRPLKIEYFPGLTKVDLKKTPKKFKIPEEVQNSIEKIVNETSGVLLQSLQKRKKQQLERIAMIEEY